MEALSEEKTEEKNKALEEIDYLKNVINKIENDNQNLRDEIHTILSDHSHQKT